MILVEASQNADHATMKSALIELYLMYSLDTLCCPLYTIITILISFISIYLTTIALFFTIGINNHRKRIKPQDQELQKNFFCNFPFFNILSKNIMMQNDKPITSNFVNVKM